MRLGFIGPRVTDHHRKNLTKCRNSYKRTALGAVAQSGERVVRNDEVRGSIPLGSTKYHASKLWCRFGLRLSLRQFFGRKISPCKLKPDVQIQMPVAVSSEIRQIDWAIDAAEFKEAPAVTQICGRIIHSSAHADPDLSCSCTMP